MTLWMVGVRVARGTGRDSQRREHARSVADMPDKSSPARQMIGDFAPKLVELTEAITHLAFYAGWPTAMTAIVIAKNLFEPKEHHT